MWWLLTVGVELIGAYVAVRYNHPLAALIIGLSLGFTLYEALFREF